MLEYLPSDQLDDLMNEFRTELKAIQNQLFELLGQPTLMTAKLDRLRSLATEIVDVREQTGYVQREVSKADLEKLDAIREAVQRRLIHWDFLDLPDGTLLHADDLCARDEVALAEWEEREAIIEIIVSAAEGTK